MVNIPDYLGWYLAGFIDGEGSFNISLRRKPDYKIKWQPVLSFNVSQREVEILVLLQAYLQCGVIKRRKDGLHSFDVTNPKDIQERVLPFFQRFSILSTRKKVSFDKFVQAVQIMNRKDHLQPQGFIKLLQLRERINPGKGRKRKYTIHDVLESSETIRQAFLSSTKM